MSKEPLPPAIRRLAWLHAANDFTLDFITPLLPSSISVAWIGIMEGIADSAANLLKMVTGRRSDATGRRVEWIQAGYATNALMRPLIAVGMFLSLPVWIVGCRIGDRIGKGLRSSAADALVADWTDGNLRARAYATMRTMDNLGAVIGALAAAGVAYCWAEHRPWAVAALVVPAGAMLWWCRGLRDYPDAQPKQGPPPGYWPKDRGLRFPLLILGVASAGAKIAPLLILAHVTGQHITAKTTAPWPLYAVCLAWAAFALSQMVASSSASVLTNRLRPRTFLLIGWGAGAVVFTGFMIAQGPWLVVTGVGYGMLVGFTEGAEKTYLSTIAPKDERALAFGALGLVTAVASLTGSIVCGKGLDVIGPGIFLVPAGLLALATLLLAAYGSKRAASA